jgi:hypothetical protein
MKRQELRRALERTRTSMPIDDVASSSTARAPQQQEQDQEHEREEQGHGQPPTPQQSLHSHACSDGTLGEAVEAVVTAALVRVAEGEDAAECEVVEEVDSAGAELLANIDSVLTSSCGFSGNISHTHGSSWGPWWRRETHTQTHA